MKDILVIGFHTYEKFIARKRVRKIIENITKTPERLTQNPKKQIKE